MKSSINRRRFLKSAAAGATAFSLITTSKSFAANENVVIGSGEYKYECEHFWGQLPDAHSYGNASHGTAFDSQGLFYVSHTGSPGSVFVFDQKGKFVKSMFPEHVKGGRASGHGIDIRKESDGKEYMYLSPANASMSIP